MQLGYPWVMSFWPSLPAPLMTSFFDYYFSTNIGSREKEEDRISIRTFGNWLETKLVDKSCQFLSPGVNVIKLYLSMIYGFSY